MKARAGAGDRVQIGSLRHEIKPTARTVRKRFRLITEVLGVTAVEEGGQVQLRPRPAYQTADCPSDPRERCHVVLHAGQAHGDPERQPVRANSIASEPTQVSRLYQSEPMPPALGATPQSIVQCAEPARDMGETCCAARLCPPPVVENRGLAEIRSWPERQIVELFCDRTRQEPQVGFGCIHDICVTNERIVEVTM